MKTQNLSLVLMVLSLVHHIQAADRHERSASWNLNGNRDTVPGTNFVGTTDNQALEFKVNGSRALRLEPHTNSPNVIGGYECNFVPPGVTGATISGGGGIYFDEDRDGVVLSNAVSADFGAIGGGNGNQVRGVGAAIAGGQFNVIETSTWYSFIGAGVWNTIQSNAALSVLGGGELNTLASPFSVIGGGIENVIKDSNAASVISGGAHNQIKSGGNGVIAGGLANEIEAAFGTIPGGQLAKVSSIGQFAYASGTFDTVGQAQTSVFVLSQETADSTPTELLVGHVNRTSPPGDRIKVPTDARWTFDILVVGSALDGDTAGYQIKGVIKNVAATTRFVGTPSISSLGIDAGAATWSVWAEADTPHQTLVIKASGDSRLIRWVASVRTVELGF